YWFLTPFSSPTFHQTGTNSRTQTRIHGPTHEFTSFTGTNSGTIAYDVKGNMTSRPASLAAPALNLVWDFDNKMKGADTNGTPATLEITFGYDALGRRISRTEGSSTIIYVQSGQQTIADYASGSATASPIYRYVYGSYIDEPLLRETITGSIKHFYHRNQQYSITALTNSSGDTAERYSYTAYGGLTARDATGSPRTTSADDNRYSYTGREMDNALILIYFRARWYDSEKGRFVSKDPVGFVNGKNLYRSYFTLAGLDPSGLVLLEDHARSILRHVFGEVATGAAQPIPRTAGAGTKNHVLTKSESATYTPESCAKSLLSLLRSQDFYNGAAKLAEDIAWQLGESGFGVIASQFEGWNKFWVEYGYDIVQTVAEAIREGLDPNEIKKLLFDILKEAGGDVFKDLDQEDLGDLISAILEQVNDLAKIDFDTIIGKSYHVSFGESGSLDCHFFVLGKGNKFKQFWVSGNCRFVCVDKGECNCPCGKELNFSVQASGEYNSKMLGFVPEVKLDGDPIIKIFPNSKRAGK
ncbi:MAG: RHS repeat-associated core domain-containing protein, partial [Bdellovibrionia bacterium]